MTGDKGEVIRARKLSSHLDSHPGFRLAGASRVSADGVPAQHKEGRDAGDGPQEEAPGRVAVSAWPASGFPREGQENRSPLAKQTQAAMATRGRASIRRACLGAAGSKKALIATGYSEIMLRKKETDLPRSRSILRPFP